MGVCGGLRVKKDGSGGCEYYVGEKNNRHIGRSPTPAAGKKREGERKVYQIQTNKWRREVLRLINGGERY